MLSEGDEFTSDAPGMPQNRLLAEILGILKLANYCVKTDFLIFKFFFLIFFGAVFESVCVWHTKALNFTSTSTSARPACKILKIYPFNKSV